MTLAAADVFAWLTMFLWPLLRIGGMVAVAPILGAQNIPLQIRVLLAVGLTLAIGPQVKAIPVLDPTGALGLFVMVSEIAIGIVIGLALRIVFSALVFAGQAISMPMALGFASVVDPQNGFSVPVVSQLYLVLATLLFLALDAHLRLIEVTATSFDVLPIGQGLPVDAWWGVAQWGTLLFEGGIMMALPVLVALLMTQLAFGVITRTAPQLNIFAVGIPLTIVIGFIVLWLTLPSILPDFVELIDAAFGEIARVLGG